MSVSTLEVSAPEAGTFTVSGDTLTTELSDGRTICVPLDWYPRLTHATREERGNWRLIGGGEGTHWPDLDEDISEEGLIAGRQVPAGRSHLPSRCLRQSPRFLGRHCSGVAFLWKWT